MPTPHITVWVDPPADAIPHAPTLLFDSGSLWVALETVEGGQRGSYAVVQFSGVIDHRLSPINDEGLGEHPYARYGLEFYSFSEVSDSKEALRWAALRPRHWVVTFKDVTLDVLASGARVVARTISAASPGAAVLSVMPPQQDAC